MELSSKLIEGAFDALPLSIAILDSEGEIVAANRTWRQFGRENDLQEPTDTVGVNYLSVTEQAVDDPHAQRAAAGLREVLAGTRDNLDFEYPCHSPTEKRWFMMHATRFTDAGTTYVAVSHDDITSRKLAEEAVADRNDDLEALARLLSHDLRNPLGVALGRADLLAEELESAHLESIQSALARMDTLIENALVLTRNDTADLNHEPLSVRALVEEAWQHVDTEQATLTVEADTEVVGHAGILANVFENLVRNAVDHGGDDVTVTVGPLDDGFYLEDDGPGIPADERESVFEFGRTTAPGHTGFGLGIVRRLVENHGWELSLTASDAGGARFEIRTTPTTSPEDPESDEELHAGCGA